MHELGPTLVQLQQDVFPPSRCSAAEGHPPPQRTPVLHAPLQRGARLRESRTTAVQGNVFPIKSLFRSESGFFFPSLLLPFCKENKETGQSPKSSLDSFSPLTASKCAGFSGSRLRDLPGDTLAPCEAVRSQKK